ncbi:MAG: hypothetical protein ACOC6G_00070 [Thermoproteota archaeon]
MSSPEIQNWIPLDGDAVVTRDGFVFIIIGYQHPEGRVFSFLKYLPSQFKSLFPLPFLKLTWNYRGIELHRPKQLYTPRNYQILLDTFQESFPEYVYFCPYRQKQVISTPISAINKIYVARQCLQNLRKLEKKDALRKKALRLVELLSAESGIPFSEFGLHGSLALNMHHSHSDIDLTIYGAHNFRTLEQTIDQLVKEGTLNYIIKNQLDETRLFRGRYQDTVFMYSAIRKPSEFHSEYGTHRYQPIKPVKFQCTIQNDEEAMFRPAIYPLRGYHPLDSDSKLPPEKIPVQALSMIGCYRNVNRQGEKIEVSGTLERVKNMETGKTHHQVVVGTGTDIPKEEYLRPI